MLSAASFGPSLQASQVFSIHAARGALFSSSAAAGLGCCCHKHNASIKAPGATCSRFDVRRTRKLKLEFQDQDVGRRTTSGNSEALVPSRDLNASKVYAIPDFRGSHSGHTSSIVLKSAAASVAANLLQFDQLFQEAIIVESRREKRGFKSDMT